MIVRGEPIGARRLLGQMKKLTAMAICKDKEALPLLMPFYYQSDDSKIVGGPIRSCKRVQYLTRQIDDTSAKAPRILAETKYSTSPE